MNVRPPKPTSRILLEEGAPAPGAGSAAGPPADAVLGSFGVPAIDETGLVVFNAKWLSPILGRGFGIFTPLGCVACTGGKFASLGEPVAGGGRVAFLATLAGAPPNKAAAVFAGSPDAIEMVARAGDPAPGPDGQPLPDGVHFQAFKAVAIEAHSLAILAQLSGGAGVARVRGSNDLGLWLGDASHSPRLVLREGQSLGARTLRTLVSFQPGNGSAGQGRGWLTDSGAENGARVLALAWLDDGTQAVLGAGLQEGVVVLCQGIKVKPGMPADQLAGSFTSFGLPALNAADTSAFLATPASDGTSARPAAQGIYLDPGLGVYQALARVNEPAGSTGATFNLIKDAVLAADDAVTFWAAIKARGITGPRAATLWWKPAGGPDLRLLAQGGTHPPEMPEDARWQSFSSLAIMSGRGPLFSATLQPRKGGVPAGGATGVWASDFAGQLRLAICTGITNVGIEGRTLRSFSLLGAAPGSMGVTRSFNNAGELVWRATFINRTTALIQTSFP